MIVDAHHHFWDPASADYPLLTDELAAIRRAFTPADLAPELAGGAASTRPSSSRPARAWPRPASSSSWPRATPFIRGVVGWVDLTAPSVGDAIAELQAGPGGDATRRDPAPGP